MSIAVSDKVISSLASYILLSHIYLVILHRLSYFIKDMSIVWSFASIKKQNLYKMS